MSAKRILILDDEPNICRSLQMILEHAGYAVTIARSIEEGRLLAARADAMLLDVRLPDGSGIDLLRQLREMDEPAPALRTSRTGRHAHPVAVPPVGCSTFLHDRPVAEKE